MGWATEPEDVSVENTEMPTLLLNASMEMPDLYLGSGFKERCVEHNLDILHLSDEPPPTPHQAVKETHLQHEQRGFLLGPEAAVFWLLGGEVRAILELLEGRKEL